MSVVVSMSMVVSTFVSVSIWVCLSIFFDAYVRACMGVCVCVSVRVRARARANLCISSGIILDIHEVSFVFTRVL